MTVLFRTSELLVTDERIRSSAGTFAIGDVRSAWVTRRQTRAGRVVTATAGVLAVLAVVAVAGLSGWLARYWMWLLAAPVVFFLAAYIGLLDPIAVYLERRHHELWITTDSVSVRLWKANSIEVNKALRAIQRARERHQEQYEV